jgi:hypothetical protein
VDLLDVARLASEGADVTVSKTVVLGPYSWNSSTPLPPGGQLVSSLDILDGLSGDVQQQLQGLSITAVPVPRQGVQVLSVTTTNIVTDTHGKISVNFIVTNASVGSNCFGYRWWVSMVVP